VSDGDLLNGQVRHWSTQSRRHASCKADGDAVPIWARRGGPSLRWPLGCPVPPDRAIPVPSGLAGHDRPPWRVRATLMGHLWPGADHRWPTQEGGEWERRTIARLWKSKCVGHSRCEREREQKTGADEKKCHVPHADRKGTDGSQECLTRIRNTLISQDGQATWRFMTTPSAGVPAVADPEDSAPPPPPLGGTRASPSHKHVALLVGSPQADILREEGHPASRRRNGTPLPAVLIRCGFPRLAKYNPTGAQRVKTRLAALISATQKRPASHLPHLALTPFFLLLRVWTPAPSGLGPWARKPHKPDDSRSWESGENP
jgi:hypothetical protein